MKKLLSLVLIVCVLLSAVAVLSACQDFEWENGNLKIVTTIFPVYDWTLNVIGEHQDGVNIINLLNSGADMHSYSPSPTDIVYIATCDLFIYVGGESDEWVEDALKQAKNKDMVVIKLLDVVGDDALHEELKEGMQGDDEEDEKEAYDEHVWLSLRRAETMVNAIAQALEQLQADNATDYAQNAQAYCDELAALDLQYQQAMSTAANKTLVIADRFPFRYLFADYGLDYYAAYPGCAAASEPSSEMLVVLITKVNELNSQYIIVTESSDSKLAQTIKRDSENQNQTIIALNSLQSTGAADRNKGVSYLTLMQSNLDVLTQVTR